ncbi:MAG: CsbD family protein [Bdellovibrionales bacterium]
MNSDTVQGKWSEIKGEVRKAWGKLTDDELDKTKGDMEAIGGLIQQRYGQAKEDYKDRLGQIFDRFSKEKDDAVEGVKDRLRH